MIDRFKEWLAGDSAPIVGLGITITILLILACYYVFSSPVQLKPNDVPKHLLSYYEAKCYTPTGSIEVINAESWGYISNRWDFKTIEGKDINTNLPCIVTKVNKYR